MAYITTSKTPQEDSWGVFFFIHIRNYSFYW